MRRVGSLNTAMLTSDVSFIEAGVEKSLLVFLSDWRCLLLLMMLTCVSPGGNYKLCSVFSIVVHIGQGKEV